MKKNLNNVKEAIIRNNIEHPVVNDPENILWVKYEVTCWPTVFIIGPTQHILFVLIGETNIEKIHFLCDEIFKYYQMGKVKLKSSPLPMKLLKANSFVNELLYPSSVNITDSFDIIISDTGHHRLLIVSREGYIKNIIGSGSMGFKDGDITIAEFNSPHGTAWKEPNLIYVADTGNHCIRLINLNKGYVSTLFPTFIKDNMNAHSCSENQSFRSPWDICLGPFINSDFNNMSVLYIAAAGSHQIWSYFTEDCHLDGKCYIKGTCAIFAGNGQEENRNNTYRLRAGFAQPSAISYSKRYPEFLLIADSESSTIRSISLKNGSVKTIVGGGLDPLDLFQFGDLDGKGNKAKLQHPLGLAVNISKSLFIADSYNHKIKFIDLNNMYCQTYAGTGHNGNKIGESLSNVEFFEPTGLCFVEKDNILLIADTNNHCIKILDVEHQKVSFLRINELYNPKDVADLVVKKDDFSFHLITNSLSKAVSQHHLRAQILPGGEVHCKFTIIADESINLTKGAPQPWTLSLKEGDFMDIICKSNTLLDANFQPSLVLRSKNKDIGNKVSYYTLEVTLYLCNNENKTCFSRTILLEFSIEISEKGLKSANLIFPCIIK